MARIKRSHIELVPCNDCGKLVATHNTTPCVQVYAKYGQLCEACAKKRGFDPDQITREIGEEMNGVLHHVKIN